MNIQLVNSLVEVVLNLPPEDQKLFQEKLYKRQIDTNINNNQTTTEKVKQFHQWLTQFPKSDTHLTDESLRRENIYDDRGR